MADQPPLDPRGDERMVRAMLAVEAMLPGYAIAIVVAPFAQAEGRRANYILNADRTDVGNLLRELLMRWDAPHHEAPARSQ